LTMTARWGNTAGPRLRATSAPTRVSLAHCDKGLHLEEGAMSEPVAEPSRAPRAKGCLSSLITLVVSIVVALLVAGALV